MEADPYHRGKTIETMLDDFGKGMAVIIAIGTPCSFLAGHKCGLYPTRPNCCVALQPGDDQCQDARRAEGLPALPPLPE